MNVEPRRLCTTLFVAAVAIGACSSEDEDPVLTEPTAILGVAYSAAATETFIDGVYRLLVTLSMENTTVVPITLTYPATCPIRIRLYRPSDNTLVYDETRLPCDLDLATVVISPQGTRTIGSGFRGMGAMLGDSLAVAAYRVVAVPNTEGHTVLEIPAGPIVIRP